MGSGSSRLGSRPYRGPVNRRNRSGVFSSLICGGSSSRAYQEMEEHPAEGLGNSEVHCYEVLNRIQNSSAESSSTLGMITEVTSSSSQNGVPSDSNETAYGDSLVENGFRNVDASHQVKNLSESKELVASSLVSVDHSSDCHDCRDSSTTASISFKERQSSDVACVNVSANKDAVGGIDNSEGESVSQIYPEAIQPTSSSEGHGGSCSGSSHGASVEDHVGRVTSSDSDSLPHVTDTSVAFHPRETESVREAIPSGIGHSVSNREQGQVDGSVLHVDVVSISPSILSSSNASRGNRESRRNSRRLFWDAVSRRSSRRHIGSPTILFPTDDSDDIGSRDRWLLDISNDFLEDGVGGDSANLGSRNYNFYERRRHSRSEIWERIHSDIDESGRRTTYCPSGLHAEGSCSCDSFLTTEEPNTRASISRIVMLAEALFEVLDEIHRQPVSLSLSMVSLPAPESVVDSFPLKNHKKADIAVEGDAEQCYICLAEYEEGDKIRVLPCHHEYHMSCVDKWLKEIHGVCPLCRGDVRQSAHDCSVSNSEAASL
ncbi:hypothetical protein HS088_TW09G00085 [Tripterygium wilfordii]|uniref:RING-type domain-containing protein n=1 Tax=Tripterygium wilfordii TaxID=458696 RepID=A0A7J7D7M4_TRIWF|nr:uncharacterized protein LOC120005750 [Tripterygium wilfordii]KAF5742046.1 hypothetical protein HS088_TW09G00085 [Tripterygium wilfordii]